jgi:hypothetical protein
MKQGLFLHSHAGSFTENFPQGRLPTGRKEG